MKLSPPKRGCGRRVWVSHGLTKSTEPLMQIPQSQRSDFLPHIFCLMGASFPFIISINHGISQQEKGDGQTSGGSCEICSVMTLHCKAASVKAVNKIAHILIIYQSKKTHSTNDQCPTLPYPFKDTHSIKREGLDNVAISNLQT